MKDGINFSMIFFEFSPIEVVLENFAGLFFWFWFWFWFHKTWDYPALEELTLCTLTSEVTHHNQLCLLDQGTILLVTGIVLPSLSKFHYLSKVSEDVVSFCIVLVNQFRNYAEPFGPLEGGRN